MKHLLQQQDFKALFDCTLDAIMVADDNGVYIAVNSAACQLLKATEEEILGHTVADFTPPTKHAHSQSRWQHFLDVGQIEGEIELLCRDGSRCVAEYRAKANFKPGQHLSVLRDISKRKRAEAELLESNRQIISIMESVSDTVLAFDSNWNFLYANPQSELILGCLPQDVVGRNLWEAYPETLGTDFEVGYRRAAREGVPVQFLGHEPDTNTWFDVHVYPSRVGVTVYLRDITSRKKSEENLRFLSEAGEVLSSSLDYGLIIHNLAELAVSHMADWCAIDILENEEIERLAVVHKDPDKVEFARLLQKLYPTHRDSDAGVAQVLRTGESFLVEEISDEMLAASAPDDRWLEMMRGLGLKSVILVPLVARGQTVGVMTLVRENKGVPFEASDLTVAQELARRAGGAVENGRLFQHMTQALRSAEEANRARDEFLAIVSHELKTPMTPILGWISLLKSEVIDSNEPRLDAQLLPHAIEVIERNVKAQSQLVNDLLDVSRIITGKLHLTIKPVSMATVVGFALETVRPAAQAKSIEIKLHIQENLPMVPGDGERLHQVAWNLLSNAIKFTPAQGQIVVELSAIEGSIVLSVRDSGQGIRAEFLPYVFDRFRQADSSSTREHGGLGLGLSIVRNLVDLHGGSVTADSQGIGHGAIFTVRLPVQGLPISVRQDDKNLTGIPNEAQEINETAMGVAHALEGQRILVVEDMPDSRELVVALLERGGAQVQHASNTTEGMALLQQWRPDVLLCDIGMPGENGYSFIKRIRALPPEQGGNTPAIALTAYGRDQDRLEALACGFQNHVVKPANATELIIAIASVTAQNPS